MSDVETQKYTITGLVDIFDEQGNITGQFPIGSVQELPVEVGAKLLDAGTVEVFEGEEEVAETGEEVAASDADLEQHEAEEHADDGATSEAGEIVDDELEGEEGDDEDNLDEEVI